MIASFLMHVVSARFMDQTTVRSMNMTKHISCVNTLTYDIIFFSYEEWWTT